MEKPKFQVITLTVKAAGEQVKIDETTKLEHKNVTGIFFTVSDATAVKAGEVELSIDGEEILPEDFEISVLTKYPENTLNETIHGILEKAGNSKVKGEYTDSGAAGIIYPYQVKIYLCTTKEVHE